LVDSGTYGSSIPLDAYRGATLCLKVRSIGEAAQLRMDSTPTGRPVFKRRETLARASTIESESE